jgi:DNA-binding response OmpR family regulator
MTKILIIDDDKAIRAFLRQQLEDAHDVADMGSPAMALNLKPDCILLDLMMPRLSGLESYLIASWKSKKQRLIGDHQ